MPVFRIGSKPRGLTMLELTVVLAVMTVLTGISLTSYMTLSQTEKSRSLLKQIEGTVSKARQLAVTRNQPVRITMTPVTVVSNQAIESSACGSAPLEAAMRMNSRITSSRPCCSCRRSCSLRRARSSPRGCRARQNERRRQQSSDHDVRRSFPTSMSA